MTSVGYVVLYVDKSWDVLLRGVRGMLYCHLLYVVGGGGVVFCACGWLLCECVSVYFLCGGVCVYFVDVRVMFLGFLLCASFCLWKSCCFRLCYEGRHDSFLCAFCCCYLMIVGHI
jgi:hypothetical protein